MVFIDESGFMLQPLVRSTWAPQGQTPIMDQWDRRVRMFFQLLDHNAKAEDFIWFLNDLRKELGRKLHVVWDNLGAHRKAENFFRAIDWPWARFHRLPAYAPELNPVEHVWSTGKWGPLANTPPDDHEHLQRQVNAEMARQANAPHRLQSHFHWTKLKL